MTSLASFGMRRLLALLFALGLLLLSGCATRTEMAFGKDSDRLGAKPVYLMSVTLRNSYHESVQPRLLVVNVQKPGAKDSSDRLNFLMDPKARMETDSEAAGNTYLIRMELDPGRHELVGLTSQGRRFPVTGLFFAPLVTSMEQREPGVYYLGHVEGTIRERQGNEFKAGPSVPLIDQAVIGASGGTWEIVISDNQASDEVLFRARFPGLAGLKIIPAVLPPFDRDNAQKFWEAH